MIRHISRFFLVLMASGTVTQLFSQTIEDGIRFSQTLNGGTARSISLGGAIGALGGDFTSLSINPAGLGVYKSGELTVTPSFKNQKVSSTYNGIKATDTRNRLYFDNVGVVMSLKPNGSDDKGLVNLNMGVGYTRTNDFFSNSIATGDNPNNSIMDFFAVKAKGYYYNDLLVDDNYNPFSESSAPWDVIMAWNTYLLYDTIAGTNGTEYEPALLIGDGVVQKNAVSTKGGSGEFDISFAANISNKLYLGLTVGIADYSFTYNATYSEDAFQSNPARSNGDRFYYSDYMQYFETSGTGYNIKLGAIYTPIPSIRIGAAIHTPTFFSFSDSYSYTMKSNFDIAGVESNFTSNSPLGKYDYDFETPFKLVGSFAYIIKEYGLISLDVEHLDYSAMRFRDGGNGDNFTDLNQSIDGHFRNVTNIRVGGEARINDFSVRAGYAYYPSPYKSGFLNDNSNTNQLSFGLGYRIGNFTIDAAYLQTLQNAKYKFYDLTDLNVVSTKTRDGKFLITLGFRF